MKQGHVFTAEETARGLAASLEVRRKSEAQRAASRRNVIKAQAARLAKLRSAPARRPSGAHSPSGAMKPGVPCRVCGSTERMPGSQRCRPCTLRKAREYYARGAKTRAVGNLRPLFPTSPPNPKRAPAPVVVPRDNERICQQGHAFDVTGMRLPFVCHCGAPALPTSRFSSGQRNRPSLVAAVERSR